jgi:hypothetical protein
MLEFILLLVELLTPKEHTHSGLAHVEDQLLPDPGT